MKSSNYKAMIHADKCLVLGIPTPKNNETQADYVKRAMVDGHKIDTRKARFIGIGNLHSILSNLTKKRFPYTKQHGIVKCHFTGEVPPFSVDICYMTQRQKKRYWEMKAAKEI